jgi:hypothetical protein
VNSIDSVRKSFELPYVQPLNETPTLQIPQPNVSTMTAYPTGSFSYNPGSTLNILQSSNPFAYTTSSYHSKVVAASGTPNMRERPSPYPVVDTALSQDVGGFGLGPAGGAVTGPARPYSRRSSVTRGGRPTMPGANGRRASNARRLSELRQESLSQDILKK